jgi:hypothetical protein
MVEVLMVCKRHILEIVNKQQVFEKNRQGASYGKH